MKNFLLIGLLTTCFLTFLNAQPFDNQAYKQTWLIENGKYMLIDTKTKAVVVPAIYEYGRFLNESFSVVKKDGLFGLVDNEGEVLLNFEYQSIAEHNKRLLVVKKNGRFRFINQDLLKGTTAQFDFATKIESEVEYDLVLPSFSDDFAIVRLGTKYGFINEKGEEVIPTQFDEVTFFENNIAAVRLGSKWGAIDKKGNQVIGFTYDLLGGFSEGQTVAKVGKKYGVINVNNEPVLPFEYKFLSNYNTSEVALARKARKWGVINRKGEEVIPFDYDFDEDYLDLLTLVDGYVWLQKEGKWGTVDFHNNIIIPFNIDGIIQIHGSHEISVWKNANHVIINELGQCVGRCAGFEAVDL